VALRAHASAVIGASLDGGTSHAQANMLWVRRGSTSRPLPPAATPWRSNSLDDLSGFAPALREVAPALTGATTDGPFMPG